MDVFGLWEEKILLLWGERANHCTAVAPLPLSVSEFGYFPPI